MSDFEELVGDFLKMGVPDQMKLVREIRVDKYSETEQKTKRVAKASKKKATQAEKLLAQLTPEEIKELLKDA